MANVVEPESVGMSSGRLERIRPAMQIYVDRLGYGGIATLVSRRGGIVWADQVGWQDVETALPFAPDTICRIYSMTKPVICTALMTLYEEGRLQLADPVSKFIPAFGSTKVLAADGSLEDQATARPMQVRDLMTHTSGLTYDFLEDFPVCALYREARLMNDATRTLEALVDELAGIPLAFQPGTIWHYSLGIDVAAHLIEVICDQPLGDVLRERLFTPLGMTDTAFEVPDRKRDRLAAMYGLPDLLEQDMTMSRLLDHFNAGNLGRRDVADTYPFDAPDVFQRGGIGLFSTAEDYIAFARMLLSGTAQDGTRILGRKTLELMHTNHLAPELLPYRSRGAPVPGWGFGLGSRVAMDLGQIAVAGSLDEFGWSGAAKTYYWVDPREELVAVLMTQCMVDFHLPENDLRALVYQAIED